MVDRRKIGRRSRRKGAAFEREVVNKLNRLLPPHLAARRRLQNRGGLHEPDVGVYERQSPIPLWHIECKTGLNINFKGAVKQAIEQHYPGARIALILRRYGKRPDCYVISRDYQVIHLGYGIEKMAEEILRDMDPVGYGLPAGSNTDTACVVK